MQLLIASPSYPMGVVHAQATRSIVQRHPDWAVHDVPGGNSLLTAAFNFAWASALNLKETVGLTHFLMIHSDILPIGEDWFDVLLAEMESHQADVISAIVPIKDAHGLTSTALDTDPWRPLRLTQRQVNKEYPRTWTAKDLLFNTGLLLVDFRGDWVEKVYFTMRDRIARDENGRWQAYVEPEDWNFSRQCRALGLRTFVTRAVTLRHYGLSSWLSTDVWGDAVDMWNGQVIVAKQAAEMINVDVSKIATIKSLADKVDFLESQFNGHAPERMVPRIVVSPHYPHFYQSIEGWFSFKDIYDEAIRHAVDGSKFVEIGCWQGKSAAYMMVEILNSGKQIEFSVVDTFCGSPGNPQCGPDKASGLYTRFVDNMKRGGILDKFHDVKIMKSTLAAARFENQSLDFIFIDGDHRYEHVVADIHAWFPKLKPGGVMAGDDANEPDVARAVRDTLAPSEIGPKHWRYQDSAFVHTRFGSDFELNHDRILKEQR